MDLLDRVKSEEVIVQVLGMLTGIQNDVLVRQGSTVIIGFVGNGGDVLIML